MAFGLQFPGAEFCVRGAIIIKEGEFLDVHGRTRRGEGTTDEAKPSPQTKFWPVVQTCLAG